jgi:multicomponent Na+:H+ antiporter subunit F
MQHERFGGTLSVPPYLLQTEFPLVILRILGPGIMAALGGPAAWFASACLVAVGASLVMTVIRLMRGPSLPDRVVSLDLVAYQAIALMLIYAILTGEPAYLDVSLVLALVAFLGTVAFARYIEYRSLPEAAQSSE